MATRCRTRLHGGSDVEAEIDHIGAEILRLSSRLHHPCCSQQPDPNRNAAPAFLASLSNQTNSSPSKRILELQKKIGDSEFDESLLQIGEKIASRSSKAYELVPGDTKPKLD
ncbi:hypothetical protein GUJ93_ZPchr0013g37454 [Zizania palustris]|uniref:Uncharacterized protein n=1 Tax=Zizania palustris TaxID=103762 RepID=A0A8J6C1T4_ZIZPA|nr:hypothetical protein GUJ93_ZPchr0013g37454 [Zizania palustris]